MSGKILMIAAKMCEVFDYARTILRFLYGFEMTYGRRWARLICCELGTGTAKAELSCTVGVGNIPLCGCIECLLTTFIGIYREIFRGE